MHLCKAIQISRWFQSLINNLVKNGCLTSNWIQFSLFPNETLHTLGITIRWLEFPNSENIKLSTYLYIVCFHFVLTKNFDSFFCGSYSRLILRLTYRYILLLTRKCSRKRLVNHSSGSCVETFLAQNYTLHWINYNLSNHSSYTYVWNCRYACILYFCKLM